MKLHANARLTPASRRLLCRRVLEEGRALAEAAEAAGVSARTARKWLARYRAEGEAGLQDRSSRPRRVPRRTAPEQERAVLALRRTRMTGEEIAACLGMAERTVQRILRRAGLGRLRALEPAEPACRFETPRPGQLVHVDIKKLARIDRAGHRVTGSRRGQRKGRVGWERVHVAVDGATRLAYVEVLADERAETACAFLRRAVAWFAHQGVQVERVLTDNGSAYRSRRHRATCAELGIRHSRTRAYRPRTNGKAERFIKTLAEGWAYGAIYGSSAERALALPSWLRHYNHRRPHSALNRQTPAARLAWLLGNNVMAAHN
jgi:transposase InsO family protein